MYDYFPPEVTKEILLKLSVKSLICMSATCKNMRSIIRSPSFISSYLYKPTNQTLLLRRYDKHDDLEHYSLLKVSENKPFNIDSSLELEIPIKSQGLYFRIVGSCRGIICLFDDFFVKPRPPIVLWNPSIQKHLVLPNPIINPKKTRSVLGFGVADNDFKVVRLVYYKKCDDSGILPPPEAEVFSLRTGMWRRLLRINVGLHIDHLFWCQVFLDGVVHWLGHNSFNDDDGISSILTFHFGQEAFNEIKLPYELARESITDLFLSLIGESLAVIKLNKESVKNSWDIWLMKEYGVTDSWTKLYNFDLVDHLENENVVAFSKNGEVLLASTQFGLLAYDTEMRHHKHLEIFGIPYAFYVDNYVESLHLLGDESRTAIESSEDESRTTTESSEDESRTSTESSEDESRTSMESSEDEE